MVKTAIEECVVHSKMLQLSNCNFVIINHSSFATNHDRPNALSFCFCFSLLVPVDWFTLVIDMPYMLFFSDLRQGLFYASLLIFWCLFAGEHILVSCRKKQSGGYFDHIALHIECRFNKNSFSVTF